MYKLIEFKEIIQVLSSIIYCQLQLQLQCKYDCLVARMKTADGVELTADFFLEQMKNEREDIKKKGLILSEELRKVIPSNPYLL